MTWNMSPKAAEKFHRSEITAENGVKTVKWVDFSLPFEAVSDAAETKTCVRYADVLTLDQQMAVPYYRVGTIFLAIMAFAKKHNLELVGSETSALAFLMNNCGLGNIWFKGCID